MKDILVIIPVHKYNDEVGELLTKAIKSVPLYYPIKISLSRDVFNLKNKEISNIIKSLRCENDAPIVTISCDDDKSDFCTLVNNAVSDRHEWFTILEFDDEFSPIWFKNVEKEMEYKTDVSVFLPLTELIDYNKKVFVSYGNEAPWASSFSNEIGYIDNESLQQFFDFYLTGGVFNSKDWLNFGGLKSSIKLTFWYEFMLRLTHNNKKIFVIPKLGYRHFVNRENSLYDIYKKTITNEESKWWYELAKEEYFFKNDRNKTYENRNNEKGE